MKTNESSVAPEGEQPTQSKRCLCGPNECVILGTHAKLREEYHCAQMGPVPTHTSRQKTIDSEQCACGHGVSQHEWEDEVTSHCMAHLRLFGGVGEGKPCMCAGFTPTPNPKVVDSKEGQEHPRADCEGCNKPDCPCNAREYEGKEAVAYSDGFISGREAGYQHCGSCEHPWACHDGECGAYMKDGSICGCRKVVRDYVEEEICANTAEKSGTCAMSAEDAPIAETASVTNMTETIPVKTNMTESKVEEQDGERELPPLKYLQPAQYKSWLKKVSDPDWFDHRYHQGKEDRAMASAIRELRDTRELFRAALREPSKGDSLSPEEPTFEEWWMAEGPCESNVSIRGHSWMWTMLKNMCEKSWKAALLAQGYPSEEGTGIRKLLESIRDDDSGRNHFRHCRMGVYYPGLKALQDDRCSICEAIDKYLDVPPVAPPIEEK